MSRVVLHSALSAHVLDATAEIGKSAVSETAERVIGESRR